VKKFLTILVTITSLGSLVFAETSQLFPASFVEVANGNIVENTLLASDEGNVFIEFSKETKFIDAEAKTSFTGEILPPQKIELDVPKPRGLMRELVTFEMVSSTGADIYFVDRYDKISRKNLYREQLLNPDGLKKSFWVKLIYLIKDENVNLPKLWEWQGEKDGWKRLGGNTTEVGDNARILSAVLRRTGIYAVFDENPSPEHFADEYEIPHQETTITEAEESFSEDGVNENLGVVADFITDNQEEIENFADFHSAGDPPFIEGSSEIPSVQATTEELEILKELEEKLSQNSAKLRANPEMERQYNDLVKILKKIYAKKQKVDTLNSELNNVSFALTRAETDIEKENLEKTFLKLQTSLYKEQNEIKELEKQSSALKENVDNFFAGITMSETAEVNNFNSPDTTDSPEESMEDVYIPENAKLVQSGGNEPQNISWVFPFFLLVCFGLLGWGVWSAKKKKY